MVLVLGVSIAVHGAVLGGVASAQSKRAAAKLHYEQGEAYFMAGTFDKAVLEYQAAYDLVPEPGLLFNIGLSHQNAGDAVRAVAAYQRYLEEAPGGAKAAEARARTEALSRELEVARQEAERASEVAERRARAAAALERDDHAAAIEELHTAETLSPDPDIVFELAEVYRASGDVAAALAEYRRYRDLPGASTHRAVAVRRITELERPPELVPRPSLKPAVVAFGTAGALVGVGAVFAWQAGGLRDQLRADLDAGTPPLDSRDPRFDQLGGKQRWANVFLGAAGVATVVGAVLLGRSLLADRTPRVPVVRPGVGDGAAGLTWETTW